jgi:hypothetical protein
MHRLFTKSGKFVFIFLFFCVSGTFNNILYAQNQQRISIKNVSGQTIEDIVIEIPAEKLKLPFGEYIAVNEKNEISPVEIITDIQGRQMALFFVPSIASRQTQTYIVRKGNSASHPKRTGAELTHKIGGTFSGKKYTGNYSWVKTNILTIPGSFQDHSYYIKYEGPGWESDKVAFRYYLDNRNAIDVFAKTTAQLVLPAVGVDGFDSYHRQAPWGMDNLSVGKSLGLGSIAIWNGTSAVRVEKKDSTTCIIAADGKLRSQVKTIYHAWQANNTTCNLTSLISIDAGNYLSHVELITDKPVDNFATGIIKQNTAKLIVNHDKSNEWSYVATFGKQSLNNDMQGLVVFVRTKQIKEITTDPLNHVVVLQPDANGYADYYIMPAWELDQEPVKTEADFLERIRQALLKLNNHINISFR